MELAQVRYFAALSRTLNFTRAAEACNVSQPALTRAVQRLEEELGGPLLFRERNLTQLTDLGRTMLPHLLAMLNAADSALALADRRKHAPGQRLSIGLGPGIGAAALVAPLRALSARIPALDVRFEEGSAGDLVDAMLGDRLDCALLPADSDMPERLHRWPAYEERPVVVLPPNHRLGNHEALISPDLAGETILVADRCGGFGARLAALPDAGVRVQRCGGSWVQLCDLVSAGLGIAVLSDRLAVPGTLDRCPLDEPALARPIALAAVAGRPHPPAVAGFMKLCRAQAL
ncbi:MAG: LysR family transcriptional regulator [Acidiphilium sp.]